MNYTIIQKSKVDDILCCLLSVIPNIYKQKIDLDIDLEQEGMKSVDLYKNFMKNFEKRFIFNSYYILSVQKLKNDIDNLYAPLIEDIQAINK